MRRLAVHRGLGTLPLLQSVGFAPLADCRYTHSRNVISHARMRPTVTSELL